MQSCTRDNLWYAGLVVGAIVLVIAVSMFGKRDRYSSLQSSQVRKIMRQAHNAAAESEQDQDPFMALSHAMRAVHFLDAARAMVSDAELEEITKLHIDEVARNFNAQAEKTATDLAFYCPTLKPDESLSAVYSNFI